MGDRKLCSLDSAAEHGVPMACAVLGGAHKRAGTEIASTGIQ